jgi:hypothetical protein
MRPRERGTRGRVVRPVSENGGWAATPARGAEGVRESGPTELRQPRDLGRLRERRRRDGRMDAWILAAAVLVVVLGLGMAVHALARPKAGQTSRPSATARRGASTKRQDGTSAEQSAVFAHLKRYGIAVHFPAIPSDMVAVGFHQAYNVHATDLVPVLQVHPKDKYLATKAALKDDPSLKLFLMMSRGRGSSEYSAADCAVRPGTILVAPVTGVVTLVKTYQLAGYGTDYRVEIKADGAAPVRLVMIHITDVTVKPGDRVEGGVTPVATVRHLRGIDSQVNKYLPVPADHTHLQVNNVGYTLQGGS